MTVQFHNLIPGVLLVLNCTLNPSGHPTSKSQVELNQVNVGNTEHFLFSLSTGLGNYLVGSKFPHLHTADEWQAQWITQAF
jgi:hypothetical protein